MERLSEEWVDYLPSSSNTSLVPAFDTPAFHAFYGVLGTATTTKPCSPIGLCQSGSKNDTKPHQPTVWVYRLRVELYAPCFLLRRKVIQIRPQCGRFGIHSQVCKTGLYSIHPPSWFLALQDCPYRLICIASFINDGILLPSPVDQFATLSMLPLLRLYNLWALLSLNIPSQSI